ncbi:LOW QUALITY PROTEIN: hypothetical protein HID58_029008 [Brassica napus]|uniref:Myb/SANT-like domain-containing protein n=1 Tax=Brassica napus TaxID=3708 RepID=A0ABQ8CBX6_BRANA|nr:LOW QUALITY PROTEIN: hypothetical protein HID58_029008 [Brassica napus]
MTVKMSSNRQRNTNSCRPTNSNQPAEDSTPLAEATFKDKYKWSYIQEKTLIQLFDEAVPLDDYTLKTPSVIGREYMVDKFNRAFNMNITYNFFKNKLDEFKKRWKTLMSFTGISVDPDTSMIYASEAWWKEREVECKLTKSLNRKPLIFWEVMVRCFALHDFQSQSQHSARQRREELINTRLVDEEIDDGSDTNSGDRPQTQPQEMEEEEVYRAIFVEAINEGDKIYNQALDFLPRVGNEEIEEDNLLRQQYKTLSLDIQNFNDKVYNNFVHYFLDIAGSIDEDKLQLLEAMTGVSRNNEDVPKQLGVDQSCRSSYSQQWGTPPTAQQWGTPPFSRQWANSTMGTTTKCSTMEHTANFSTMRHTTKLSTMGTTAKYFTVEYATKCFTVGHTTKCFTVGTFTKYFRVGDFIKLSTRRTIKDESNNCSIWIFRWSEEESLRNTQENNAAVGISPNTIMLVILHIHLDHEVYSTCGEHL